MNFVDLHELLAQDASVTLKCTKGHTMVIARLPDGESYKATGASPEVALERCLEKVEKHGKNIKKLRRQRERERREIMDEMMSPSLDENNQNILSETEEEEEYIYA